MKRLLLIILFCFFITIMGFCKWYIPDIHYDPDNLWNNETLIYDDNDITAGDTSVAKLTWSSFILLDVYNELYCEIIKFLAYQKGILGIEKIDIDLYYNSAWHDLFEGTFINQVWKQINVIPSQYLYSARIRFYARKADIAYFYGFEYWNIGIGDLITMDFSFQAQPFINITAKDTIDLETMDYAFQGQPFVTMIEAVAGWSHKWNTVTISKWNTTTFSKWNGLE